VCEARIATNEVDKGMLYFTYRRVHGICVYLRRMKCSLGYVRAGLAWLSGVAVRQASIVAWAQ